MLVDFSCTTNTCNLARAELESLLKDFQSVGWAGLKRAHKLLATERFEKAFLATSTVTCMIVFRETCFEAVTILKDGGILKAQRQRRSGVGCGAECCVGRRNPVDG
jgi:hypothetical protein